MNAIQPFIKEALEDRKKTDNDYEDNVILFFSCACLAPLNTLS